MTALEVSWALEELADLLELREEKHYKIRAYRVAAKAIAELEQDVQQLSREELLTLPGIGKNIASKIEELVNSGTLHQLEQLRQQIHQDLRKMLTIPGLGVKSVLEIHKRLGVTTLQELETAARERKIRTLPRMGSKTELAILRGIKMLEDNSGKVLLSDGLRLAQIFKENLFKLPGVKRIEEIGSLRRGKDMVSDVDLLIAAETPDEILQVLGKHPMIREVIAKQESRVELRSVLGVIVEAVVVPPHTMPLALVYGTGSKDHLADLQRLAEKKNLALQSEGLRLLSGEILKLETEEQFYQVLEIPFIFPELREGRGEVEAALAGKLPNLLSLENIKGDLHLHSEWSDGVNTLEEIVEAARKKGYQYIAITDHSRSLHIANGLSLERVKEQHHLIKELNESLADILIFTGVETDILKDGSLDYPDELLAQADIVIASVHTSFRMGREEMTARVERAIRNPYVTILAHPTGRLLGRREGYEIDLEQVMQTAAGAGVVLEVNSSPDRLDLSSENVRVAKEKYGLKIAINTDAHDTSRMGEMRFGIMTARRGWLEKSDVINTWEPEKLKRFLRQKGKTTDGRMG